MHVGQREVKVLRICVAVQFPELPPIRHKKTSRANFNDEQNRNWETTGRVFLIHGLRFLREFMGGEFGKAEYHCHHGR